jgi:protoporphyrinogen/coproporphyrinogen III oxidase
MSEHVYRIAIVGGGISGLSSAFYIRKLCKEQGVRVEITLIEQSDRLGGKVATLHRDGCVIERGPDSFLARKLPIIDLTLELGIEDELTAMNPKAKSFIIHRRKLHSMPQGLVLGIPTEVMPFVRTSLISPLGKARAAMDLILPKHAQGEDEALGAFLQRRLGKEVLEHIVEPLLAGIYAGDTQALSLKATFPQFGNLEQKYGSLILGMIRNKQLQKKATSKAVSVQTSLPAVAKNAMFLTYKQGLTSLITALSESLNDCEIVYGQSVTELSKSDQGTKLRLSNGREQVYDAVVLTVPNYAAASMLKGIAGVDTHLIDIPYASVANVVMAFRRKDIESKLNGSGFVVPRDEGLTITACTWTSVKWLHTAPDELALVRCYVGRYGDDRGMTLSDDELISAVRADLRSTMDITSEPVFVEPTRWSQAMPQYPVGHLDRLRTFRGQLSDALPGVFVAGAGYLGVGLPDCIAQGKQAAQHVLGYLPQ